jgi:hypothetical protein
MDLNYSALKQTLKALLLSSFIFSITIGSPALGQSLTLQSPNGGEVWSYGGAEVVTWTGEDLSSYFNIYMTYDGGDTWYFLGEVPGSPNGGSAYVQVPFQETENALLRVTDAFYTTASDQSDGPFTVFIPSISITEPYSGSVIFTNQLVNVFWLLNVSGITLLNAEISLDNGQSFELIAENINALAGYATLILSDTPSDSAIIRLYSANNPSLSGLSDVLTINQEPVYNITSPAGGEVIDAISPFTITWDVEDPYSEFCYLEYSSDNGQNWTVIDNGSNVGTSGSYIWETPDINSEQCLIRITDTYDQASRDTSEIFSIIPFPETPVCMVTVDSLSGNNMIIWEKPDTDLINDFLVYKETDQANVYIVIDTVNYNDVTMVMDYGSNPAMRPYRYKVGYLDFENKLFPAGPFHQTLHLTISQGTNGNWNLIWTPYIGFEYSSYNILRKSESGSYEQIATISSSFNSFTDFDAPLGDVAYMVQIVHPSGCNAGLRDNDYTTVSSNEASLETVSVADNKEVDFSIYPNPANDNINFIPNENNSGLVSIKITDLTGRNVFTGEFRNVQPGQVLTLNSSGFRNGIYLIYLISGDKMGTGKIVVRR